MTTMKEYFLKIKGSAYERSFQCRIPDHQVIDEGVTTNRIKPNESYFDIHLAEIFLKDKRKYWVKYIPFVVASTELLHDNEMSEATREAIPFLLTRHILGPMEQYVGNEYVEYRNTRVAGPLPYMGDDVTFFLALYGTKSTDVTERLFEFVGKVIGVVEMGGLTPYLGVARNLKDCLSSLLNLNGTQKRLGSTDSFTDKAGDPRELRECYLAYINCPEQKVRQEELWVYDNRLYSGTRESHEPFQEYDYCLVRIDERRQRNFECLPFHRIWKQLEGLIFQGGHAEADVMFRHLAQAVAISPDLTKCHRTALQLAYKMDFETAVEHDNRLKGKLPKDLSPTRGPRTGLTPRGVLNRTAAIAERSGMSRSAGSALREMVQHWEEIPHLTDRPANFRLNDAILNDQVAALSRIAKIQEQDPEDLARVLAFEMVGSS